MTWEEVKELGPLYAIGGLDVETSRAIDEFLRRATPEQIREIDEWREVAAAIPLALPEVKPPAQLKDRLMSRIAAEPQTIIPNPGVINTQVDKIITKAAVQPAGPAGKVIPFAPAPRKESTILRTLLMAATVLLALTTAFFFWRQQQAISERDELAKKVDELQLERAQIANQLTRSEEELNKIISPFTKVISMVGDAVPQASAKLVWDTTKQTWVIYIYNLPAPPSDKDYQLWYVTKDDVKISADVFQTDARGRVNLKLTLPSDLVNGLAATAVTLEPKGGSPQPTSQMYLKAAI
jgi:anti-sigma-K factor RskA